MKPSDKALERLFRGLREEHRALDTGSTAFSESLMSRLAETDAGTDEDLLLLAPEADPELEGAPLAKWLREETNAELESRSLDWASFNLKVLSKVDVDSPEVAKLPENTEMVSVASLLKSDRDRVVEDVPEASWAQFKVNVFSRMDVTPMKFLWMKRVSEWWRTVEDIGLNWRVGIAAVGVASILLTVRPAVDLIEETSSRNALSGDVSVDSVRFEGDMMMIPDEGVTLVVLTGV